MGSLASRAKAPQVTYVTQTQPDTTLSTSTTSGNNTAEQTQQQEQQSQSAARSDDLLRRQRGRSGTILTSFRGLESSNTQNAGRKTLLGE